VEDAKSNVSRRTFLTVLTGSAAASLAGCAKRPPRLLIPDTVPSDDMVPGIARYYRSICRGCSAACGVAARVREGRAVKLEGNPQHPMNRGALCLRGQAAIEDLYAPDRLGQPLLASAAGPVAATWDQAMDAFAAGLRAATSAHRRIVVLTRPEPGALGSLLRSWLSALGQDPSQVVTFEPTEHAWLREGARRALGVDGYPTWDLAQAKTLLSIGDDFLEDWGSPVEHQRALAELRAGGGRFVYVGPRLSLTAAAADEWIATKPGSEAALVLGLARAALEHAGPATGALPSAMRERLGRLLAPYDPERVAAATEVPREKLRRLSTSFLGANPSLCLGPGRAALGPDRAELAEAVFVLNVLAGNLGRTLRFLAPADQPWAAPAMSVDELATRAAAGEVGALVVHHANPLGYGPAFARLGEALGRIPMLAVFTNRLDETGRKAQVILPDHHFLEAWGDATPQTGIRGIQQPVMTPVHPTRAAGTVLLEVGRTLEASGLPDGDFDTIVRNSVTPPDLERGGVFTEPASLSVKLVEGALARLPSVASRTKHARAGQSPPLAVLVAPSVRYLDGLVPVGGLLQEVPDPLTMIAWGGWVELHPVTAERLGVATGDLVRIATDVGQTELSAFLYPGVRQDALAVPMPYALALLGADAGLVGAPAAARIEATGRKSSLVPTTGSLGQHGRGLAREVIGASALPPRPALPSMYDEHIHPVHRWGMAIDLDACTGCGACVGACYVENNLPIVGAAEVANGRDMGWIHIQRFIEGPTSHPRALFLPSLCQHCSNAPCESVCPTYATYHTSEGLNAQIYSRCVGTRYCENNCPYGVRRFNWFDWPRRPPASLGLNPDVTVRERGVVEKCTLCIQRIRGGKEQARIDGRELKDGDITPACAQSCPSQAIIFGDLKDPSSRVSQAAANGRAYRLMEELNTRPGLSYLARRREDGTT
jgi:anaerobic selenocysteine-containing dehydrogenase/Fe-S-cluster-containing dehydrogenase component